MIDEKARPVCLGLFSASTDENASILEKYSCKSLLSDSFPSGHLPDAASKSRYLRCSLSIQTEAPQLSGQDSSSKSRMTPRNMYEIVEYEWKSPLSRCNLPSRPFSPIQL
jgi:hypothetical protein